VAQNPACPTASENGATAVLRGHWSLGGNRWPGIDALEDTGQEFKVLASAIRGHLLERQPG
jgi:hypothetical protein